MDEKLSVVTTSEMKERDSYMIENIGIDASVLMEKAALAVVKRARKYVKKQKIESPKVLVVCGSGNNGGDGFAIARLLSDLGWQITCSFVGNEDRMTTQAIKQRNILLKYQVEYKREIPDKSYDLMIDAMIGIGCSGKLKDNYINVIEKINAKNGYVIAVDIPTGVNSDTGQINPVAIRASETVSFGFLKKGMFAYPGRSFCGKISCEQIGILQQAQDIEHFTYQGKIKKLVLPRKVDGNKGTFGKVLIVAGSHNMAGAAILCAKAAYRAGAGMVKIVTCKENRIIIQESLPEALLFTYEDTSWDNFEWRETWYDCCKWADTIVFGCGCGQNKMITKIGFDLFKREQKPLVIDADGLLILKQYMEVESNVASGSNWTLTPHMAELARLLQSDIREVKESFQIQIQEKMKQFECIWVCKDAITTVMNRQKIYYNISGNSGMATAGSGDVLAGMIGAFICQEIKQTEHEECLFEAVWKAVYVHGKCANYYCENASEASFMALDYIESLGRIYKNEGIC